MSDNRYSFDPVQKRLTFRSMLVSQSTTPNAPASAIGVEVSSQSPIPKLRAEIRLPKLSGSIDVFNYVALDVKLVIEITPKPRSPQPPRPPAVPVPLPIAPAEDSTDWTLVIGAGLVATAVIIVAGTIIEDFVTAGAGTLDDPASFAAAAATAAKGIAMMGGAATFLPRARVPASVEVTTRVHLSDDSRK